MSVSRSQTHLCNDFRQAGVAHDQPAPWGDAIGLVLKLLGVDVIEIFEPVRQQNNLWFSKERETCKISNTPSITRRVKSLRGHSKWFYTLEQLVGVTPSSYTVFLMISEWMRATPLTAWDPTMHRWAMLIFFVSPSSIRDIRRRRSLSPGYSLLMRWRNKNTDFSYPPSELYTHTHTHKSTAKSWLRLQWNEKSWINVMQVVPQGASCLSHRWCPNDEGAGFWRGQ